MNKSVFVRLSEYQVHDHPLDWTPGGLDPHEEITIIDFPDFKNFQKRKIVKSGRFERFDDFSRLAPLCGVQKRFWQNFWRKTAKTKVIFLHHFLKHQYHGK